MNRSKQFTSNTIINYGANLGNMAVNFFSIPLLLSIMGTERFGIWQTMLTIIGWASLANFGVGNGLRNKVTELLSNNKQHDLKFYISSAYYVLLTVAVILSVIAIVFTLTIDTSVVFKNSDIASNEIKVAIVVVVLNFTINFILGLVNSILYGLHKSSFVSIGQFLITLLVFLTLVTIRLTGLNNVHISVVALIFLAATSIINVLISVVVFRKFVERPKYKNVNKDYGKGLFKVGINFFVLQLATIFVFSIDNFLVSTLLGVKEVAAYSIATKLIMLFNTFFSILLIQLWNAAGDAYNRQDHVWIGNIMRKLHAIFFAFSIFIIITSIFFNTITKIWLQQSIDINHLTIYLISACVIIQMFNGIAVNIENGTGLIKPQIISYVIAGSINIPLTFYLVKIQNLGIDGVVIAKIICLLIPATVCSMHVRRILILMRKRNGAGKELSV
ncbi:oligosaccharide flippase family protein [Paenibacillus sp. BK720]|uniref:oligosaccharide flippase family protein n=1 Tax=Paenibacillus sp. BK720 TaxID=2587092 RepID=UPI00141E3944|nr:O-antigen/teichoic acid export membrane protein [Paenibacillus sp. BK720]